LTKDYLLFLQLRTYFLLLLNHLKLWPYNRQWAQYISWGQDHYPRLYYLFIYKFPSLIFNLNTYPILWISTSIFKVSFHTWSNSSLVWLVIVCLNTNTFLFLIYFSWFNIYFLLIFCFFYFSLMMKRYMTAVIWNITWCEIIGLKSGRRGWKNDVKVYVNGMFISWLL